MKYSIDKTHFSDFNIISINRLSSRSYFIPYASSCEERGVSLLEKRYRSTLVECLNGEWDFCFFKDPSMLPLELDTDTLEFDSLQVPSCWQYKGYCRPFYLNVRYQFPYNPPEVPGDGPIKNYRSLQNGRVKVPEDEKNYAGVYRRFINIDKRPMERYVLSLLGVCSCADIYLNGSFVGYGEESHNTMEFDLTNYALDGRNELVVVVRRWCNGSYLECQDMFRNNGIFRDVLLRREGAFAVTDLNFTPVWTENGYQASVHVETRSDCELTVSLGGPGLNVSKKLQTVNGNAEISIECPGVTQWNADRPVLYDLCITAPGCFIRQRVGFKRIEIDGNRFLFNGAPIKLHGVNHHDTDPFEGWYMTPEKIERDLKLCKEFNVDTIRTSHYAPDPLLLELAAELGLYIVDEVDLETHGVFAMKFPPSYNRISNNPRWKEHYVSRARNHFGRDKLLSTPVIMWSLGNESGAGVCTDAEYAFFKSVSTIPVHYESAVHNRKIMAYDVAGNMYPPVATVEKIGRGEAKDRRFRDRPYFLCEYAHAMGVGPGNIEAYWDSIYSHENLMGGCIWEMNDHGVQHPDGSITYGGDHGEFVHDGNFCCDGLFYPDRTPSTGAYIMKHAYRPLRISLTEDKKLQILNTTGFLPGGSFSINVSTSLGEKLSFSPQCGPLETELLDLGLEAITEECFVDIETFDVRSGAVRDHTQFIINKSLPETVKSERPLPEWFSLSKGMPVIKSGELTVSADEEYTLLYRAATDNDVKNFVFHIMDKWYRQRIRLIGVNSKENRTVVRWLIRVGVRLFVVTDAYSGTENGVLVTSRIHSLIGKGCVPRFAKAFVFPEAFDSVSWFGKRDESYIDMSSHTPVGEYSADVKNMMEPNLKPQESGNRQDTRWAELKSKAGSVRFTASGNDFNLGVKTCTDRALKDMTHREDMLCDGTHVALSAFQQGIGTGSCGPSTLPEHRRSMKKDCEFSFEITLC